MTPDTGNPENHSYLGEDVGTRAGCGGKLREFCSVELKMVGGGNFFSQMRKLRQRAESGLDQDLQGVSHGISHQESCCGRGTVFPLTAKDGYSWKEVIHFLFQKEAEKTKLSRVTQKHREMPFLNICDVPGSSTLFLMFLFIYLFIWLHEVLVAACRIFCCGMGILSCRMWGLIPWLGIKPGPPALGVWGLGHGSTREVTGS